jgi:hypothetical protein
MNRLNLDDTIETLVTKMSDGNPGAIQVCIEILAKSSKIDPQGIPLAGIMYLDSMGIYGPNIWMLFKDVCRENIALMIAVLRSYQLGFITECNLKDAIVGNCKIDVDLLYTKVKEKIVNFDLYLSVEDEQIPPTQGT